MLTRIHRAQLTHEHVEFLNLLISRHYDVIDAYNFRINHDVDQDSWYEDLRTRVVLGAAPSCNDTALAEDLALLDKTFADALLVYKP
jgi:hypothetical protein